MGENLDVSSIPGVISPLSEVGWYPMIVLRLYSCVVSGSLVKIRPLSVVEVDFGEDGKLLPTEVAAGLLVVVVGPSVNIRPPFVVVVEVEDVVVGRLPVGVVEKGSVVLKMFVVLSVLALVTPVTVLLSGKLTLLVVAPVTGRVTLLVVSRGGGFVSGR